jgi:single-stranded DNA-binding protein
MAVEPARPKSLTPSDAPEESPVHSRVTVSGLLIAHPELRHTAAGVPVTQLQLATQGTDDTIVLRVFAFHRLAEITVARLALGQRVRVEGCLRGRGWVDVDGTACYDTEIMARRVEILSARAA